MNPGIYDITEKKYHADPAPVPSISSGIAKIMLTRSPWHARIQHPRLNPDFEPKNAKQFDLGSAAHSLILGDPKKFVHIEADSYKTKVAQEARDAAYDADQIPLLPEQFKAVQAMERAMWPQLAQQPDLLDAWDDGKSEQSAFWQEGSAWCRIRCDRLSISHRHIFDYKSIKNASPDACVKQVFNMGWEVQEGLYRRGIATLLDMLDPSEIRFTFLFQETEPPYAICAVELDPQSKAYADERAGKAIQMWTDCMATGDWSGYPARICYGELPAWTSHKWAAEQFRDEVEEDA